MTPPAVQFGPDALLDRLARLPSPERRYWVAFSGGADSTALLAGLAQARDRMAAPLSAIHVNHALHPDADAWQAHCARVCGSLAVPLLIETVTWTTPPRANLEARAREARYDLLARHLGTDELVLTAHQRDDQAETLLLALLRGSGVDGLGAMAPLRRLGRGWLARPLLDFDHAELVAWLREQNLRWLEDPANEDPRHDRNHLRRVVMPALTRRWPSAAANFARSAGLCRETSTTLSRWARERLPGVGDGLVLDLRGAGADDDAERRLLVRAWLERQGAPGLPGARLREFTEQVAGAGPDARTQCAWAGWRLHAWDGRLWLSRADARWALARTPWRLGTTLQLGGRAGTLACEGADAGGSLEVTVRSRRPGDRIREAGSAHHRRVKDLLREWRIPPWMRDAVPVLELEGQLVAVGDRALHARLAESLGDDGAHLHWMPADASLAHAWSDTAHGAG